MKNLILILITLFTSQLLLAQAPKSPSGKSLYKKGDCERVSVNFVTCIYCEDKALTKNCKKYWCTDDGTCSPAPRKNPNGELTRIEFGTGTFAEIKKEDTTSRLPKGTGLVNGKITVQNGYTAVYTKNKEMVVIFLQNTPTISGSFRCTCGTSSASCSTVISGTQITCTGDGCCKMIVTVGGAGTELTLEKVEKEPEKFIWKKLITTSKEDT